MKINLNDIKPEEMYKVGNVIRKANHLYLVAKVDNNDGYALVDLQENKLLYVFDTLEELTKANKAPGDILVNTELNVL